MPSDDAASLNIPEQGQAQAAYGTPTGPASGADSARCRWWRRRGRRRLYRRQATRAGRGYSCAVGSWTSACPAWTTPARQSAPQYSTARMLAVGPAEDWAWLALVPLNELPDPSSAMQMD
jgi:hypothetical protein